MAILVTGGAGYIGSVTVEALRAEGESVVVLDDLSNGHREAVAPDVPFYEGNIGDTALLAHIAVEHKIDQLVHFAGYISVPESMTEPLRYFENNTGKTVKMLSALREQGLKNVVFSSTAAVYGEPDYTPIDEDHSKRPANPYGLSKYFVEQILDWTESAFGVTHVILRYFNAAGATISRGEAHKVETHLIPLVLQVAAGKRECVTLYGADYPTPDGTCVRDYIHVADLADAHVKALRYLKKGGDSQKINLGNGKGFSVREVVAVAEKVTGVKIPVKKAPRREGDPSVLVADAKKARRILGWIPCFSDLEVIVRSAWEWYRAHPESCSCGKISSSF
ncbi:MAG: UDP-glucose 4-epimerase GalE [Synergistaceae bacterium]|jgi:UDP-glucose 4-epimerase|nr:UDP-glucose 4-epimerase GalE [Synergistaceae bacterium]